MQSEINTTTGWTNHGSTGIPADTLIIKITDKQLDYRLNRPVHSGFKNIENSSYLVAKLINEYI